MDNDNDSKASNSGLTGLLAGAAAIITAIGSLLGIWFNRDPQLTSSSSSSSSTVSEQQFQQDQTIIVQIPELRESQPTQQQSSDESSSVPSLRRQSAQSTIENDSNNLGETTSSSGLSRNLVQDLNQAYGIGQSVSLTASDADAQINVRIGPGKHHRIKHYGLNGDNVSVLKSGSDNTGFTWYEVKFPDSGATGWVREDFLADN